MNLCGFTIFQCFQRDEHNFYERTKFLRTNENFRCRAETKRMI